MSSVLYSNTFTDVSMMDLAAAHALGLLHGTGGLLETRVGYVSVTTVHCSIAKTQDSQKMMIVQDTSHIMPSPQMQIKQVFS